MASTDTDHPAGRVSLRLSMSVVLPALFAALLGLFILYGVGFASPDVLHNAAHDTRHSLTFPCH